MPIAIQVMMLFYVRYGLASSVWTENAALALETAISMKSGNSSYCVFYYSSCFFIGACWINCHNVFDAAAGFGGYRESGFGRDGGKEVFVVSTNIH